MARGTAVARTALNHPTKNYEAEIVWVDKPDGTVQVQVIVQPITSKKIKLVGLFSGDEGTRARFEIS